MQKSESRFFALVISLLLLMHALPAFANSSRSVRSVTSQADNLTIVASADVARRIGPRMVVYADGKVIGETRVMARRDRNESERITYRLRGTPQKVEIAFINDYDSKKHDRNLYIYSLRIAGTDYAPTQATYDRGSVTWADSSWDQPGQQAMYWDGKLIFTIATPPVSVNGACGSSNGANLAAAPAANLCAAGSASSVIGVGPWAWSCNGTNGGTAASCSASLPASCVDAGGVSHPSGSSYSVQTSQSAGTATPTVAQCPGGGTQATITTVTQNYLCTNGTAAAQGSPVTTTANSGAPVCNLASVNGSCGAPNGTTLASAPASNLCSTGTPSAVSGAGPWSWACAGSNGGTNASCSAQLQAATNSLCGTSNGGSFSTPPFSGLCASGTASPVSGSGPWTWSCAGANGSTAACSAALGDATDGQVLALGSYTSPAAATEIGKLCTRNADGTWPAYPQEWTWDSAKVMNQPAAATSGTRRVEEYVRDATTDNAESTYYTDTDTGIRYRLVAVYGYLGGGDSACDWSTPFTTRYQAAGQTWDGSIIEALAAAVPEYQLPDCGPFQYDHKQQSTNDGDLFLVYPAVYEGAANQPHFGETYGVNDYSQLVAAQQAWIAQYGALYQSEDSTAAGILTVPPEPGMHPLNNVTVKGVTENNTRPVILAPGASDYLSQGAIYIGCCTASPLSVVGLTIENIDLISEDAGNGSMRAAIYINGASNLTLKDMRVGGFESAQADGLFSTENTAGTLTIDGVEIYHNGGIPDDYAHNTYFNHSKWDPNFTVHMINSWSHDSFAGHLFKSRAQINILEGNYFQGGLPQNTTDPDGNVYYYAEDYDTDIPNGGTLVARNNIYVKNLDDNNTGEGNRIELAYAMEGLIADGRINQVDIENNTFVGMSQYWQSTTGYQYSLVPMDFSYPPVIPDPVNGLVGMVALDASGNQYSQTIPASSVIVKQNAFVGFCGSFGSKPSIGGDDPISDYRGDLSVTDAFSELNPDYSFSNKWESQNTAVVGTPEYSHAAQTGLLRSNSTIGARD